MSFARVTQFPTAVVAAGGTTRVTQAPTAVVAAGGTTRVTQFPIAPLQAGGTTRVTQFFAFVISGAPVPPPTVCPGETDGVRIDGIAAPYPPSLCAGGSGTLGAPNVGV